MDEGRRVVDVLCHMRQNECRIGVGRDDVDERSFGGRVVEGRIQARLARVLDEMRIDLQAQRSGGKPFE